MLAAQQANFAWLSSFLEQNYSNYSPPQDSFAAFTPMIVDSATKEVLL